MDKWKQIINFEIFINKRSSQDNEIGFKRLGLPCRLFVQYSLL